MWMTRWIRCYLNQLYIRSLANITIWYVRVAMSGGVQQRYNLSENIFYWTTLIQPCSSSAFNHHTRPERGSSEPNEPPWIRRCWAFDWYQYRWPWMTLNGETALILRYFTEFGNDPYFALFHRIRVWCCRKTIVRLTSVSKSTFDSLWSYQYHLRIYSQLGTQFNWCRLWPLHVRRNAVSPKRCKIWCTLVLTTNRK